ncbi:unnamed protein product, partial [marine sediment metagenome]
TIDFPEPETKMPNVQINPPNYFWILLALCLPVTIASIDVMAVGVALNNLGDLNYAYFKSWHSS